VIAARVSPGSGLCPASGPAARGAAPPCRGSGLTERPYRHRKRQLRVGCEFWHGTGFTATTRRSAPPAAHRYSAPCSFRCLETSLTPTGLNMPIGSIAARGSHVPHRRLNRARATFMPDTAWPGPQAPARLIPGQDPGPGSDAVHTLSALQQWFTHVRLPSSHLTHHVRLFRSAHHPGSFTGAACGGFGPLPA